MIIGAGIFVITGTVAKANAGPVITISFAIAGPACARGALLRGVRVYLMLNLTGGTWVRFLVWMAIGVVFYVVYGRTHGRLGRRAKAEVPLPD